MATTSITSNLGNISSYSSRMVSITFTGGQSSMRLAHQTRSVPYDRLSQTMQNIHRQGGRVNEVFMHAVSADQIAVPTNHGRAEESAKDQGDAGNKKKKR
jgi:CpcD/allophycocyanin linker domain